MKLVDRMATSMYAFLLTNSRNLRKQVTMHILHLAREDAHNQVDHATKGDQEGAERERAHVEEAADQEAADQGRLRSGLVAGTILGSKIPEGDAVRDDKLAPGGQQLHDPE